MNIKKFSKYPISKSITAVFAVMKSVKGLWPEMASDRVRGAVHTADTQYNFDDLGELNELNAVDLAKVNFILVQLRYANAEGEHLDIELIHSDDDSHMKIDCSGLSVKSLEELFVRLHDDVFLQGYYRYSAEEEAENIQKEAIITVLGILDVVDDLQVRSLSLIKNEKDFQNFLYPILRSHFSDLEDEHYLPKYAAKSYQPDFGIPTAKLLIEAKAIRTKTDLKKVQAELHDDVAGYLNSNDKYNKIIAVIYNLGGVAVNRDELRQLEAMSGLERVLICNNVTPNNLEGSK